MKSLNKILLVSAAFLVAGSTAQASPATDILDTGNVILEFQGLQGRFFAEKVSWIKKGRSLHFKGPQIRAPFAYIKSGQAKIFCRAFGFSMGREDGTEYPDAIGNFVHPKILSLKTMQIVEGRAEVMTEVRCYDLDSDLDR